MANQPQLKEYTVTLKRGRTLYEVDLKSTLGEEAAVRRARLAIAVRLNVMPQHIALVSVVERPQ